MAKGAAMADFNGIPVGSVQGWKMGPLPSYTAYETLHAISRNWKLHIPNTAAAIAHLNEVPVLDNTTGLQGHLCGSVAAAYTRVPAAWTLTSTQMQMLLGHVHQCGSGLLLAV